jgi:hypothetical protein
MTAQIPDWFRKHVGERRLHNRRVMGTCDRIRARMGLPREGGLCKLLAFNVRGRSSEVEHRLFKFPEARFRAQIASVDTQNALSDCRLVQTRTKRRGGGHFLESKLCLLRREDSPRPIRALAGRRSSPTSSQSLVYHDPHYPPRPAGPGLPASFEGPGLIDCQSRAGRRAAVLDGMLARSVLSRTTPLRVQDASHSESRSRCVNRVCIDSLRLQDFY